MFEDLKKFIGRRYAVKYLTKGLAKIWELADGKKTYIVVIILVLDGLGDFLVGEISPAALFDKLWLGGLLLAGGHKAEKILAELREGNRPEWVEVKRK